MGNSVKHDENVIFYLMGLLSAGAFVRGAFFGGAFVRGAFVRGAFVRGAFVLHSSHPLMSDKNT